MSSSRHHHHHLSSSTMVSFAIPEPVVKYTIDRISVKDSKTGNRASNETNSSTNKHNKHNRSSSSSSSSHASHPQSKPLKSPLHTPVPNLSRPPTSKGRCSHLEIFKKSPFMVSYLKAHSAFVFPLTDKQRRLKHSYARCVVCDQAVGVHICLKCVYFGCIKSGHFQLHFQKTGHELACNLSDGTIYCFQCCDVFYDRDFARSARTEMPGITIHRKSNAAALYGRIFTKPQVTSSKSVLGLRGLINLGHTCFMSSIVQALIHTPILRDFFLSNKIKCSEKHDVSRRKPCIVSLVAELYQEFYNGHKAAMSLHGLLFKIWANAAHLAGYEQQDAHEFFIAVLDALHLHFHAPDPSGICKCVIDVIFLGKLESAVTCIICGHKSITIDPFWDTSLDLMTDDPAVTLTLNDCLTRYTRVEHLGSAGKIWCNMCKNNQESTKQLKFKTLPMVLCLHLKRFEHKTNFNKIDTRVEFPEHLFMHEYTSDFQDGNHWKPSFHSEVKKTNSRYILYAVVNHVGSLEGGHYYAYVRHAGGSWYKCDDHWVSRSEKSDVLASPGYLLFYHKEVLFTQSNV